MLAITSGSFLAALLVGAVIAGWKHRHEFRRTHRARRRRLTAWVDPQDSARSRHESPVHLAPQRFRGVRLRVTR